MRLSSHEMAHIRELFILRELILQTRMSFGLTLPYFMFANSDGSGETARMEVP